MGVIGKHSLSAFDSPSVLACIDNVTLKQSQKTLNGGYAINFVDALSCVNSFKNLNYSNFFLTPSIKLSDVVDVTSNIFKPTSIFTAINFSTTSTKLLYFKEPELSFFKDGNDAFSISYYGAACITDEMSPDTTFEIVFLNSSECTVANIRDSFRYYLVVSDDAKEPLFVSENKLGIGGNILEYFIVKSHGVDYIYFTTTKSGDKYIIENDGVRLHTTLVGSISSTIDEFYLGSKGARLSQEVKFDITTQLDSSFVTYLDTNFNIDTDNSDMSIPSNYLIHAPSQNTTQHLDFISLKSTANNLDYFNSSNNLLSASETPIYAQGRREYTTIFSDIDSRHTKCLELNYVFYNQDIVIRSGDTTFTVGSSMNPFSQININDTKLADCGAFAFTLPYLSDRVYRIDGNGVDANNATLLCTWLSGSGPARGTWVDRYYYPDYITKLAALSAAPLYNPTYNDTIESLISGNTTLRNSVKKKQYFDKKSDLLFEPNISYRYHRGTPVNVVESITFCDDKSYKSQVPFYYKDINTSGGFALAFSFNANDEDFSVTSDRNDIAGGLTITKSARVIEFELALFDNAREEVITFSKSVNIVSNVSNNVLISFNGISGRGVLYVNGSEEYTFDTTVYQMLEKVILFGNINIVSYDSSDDILKLSAMGTPLISNIYLVPRPINGREELSINLVLNSSTVQDLHISLPCGMRNSTDNINVLNTLGSNLASKSNIVDINIKNLNISDGDILDSVKNTVLAAVAAKIPATTSINNVNFSNYK